MRNLTREDPFDISRRFGVAIKVTDIPRRLTHVGLLYAGVDGTCNFLHFACHCHLVKDEAPFNEGYLWSECPALARVDARLTADFFLDHIESVYILNKDSLVYGVNAAGCGFDVDGNFYSLDPARGLTCATFLACLFESAGLKLLLEDTWPARATDQVFKANVLFYLDYFGFRDRAEQICEEDVPFRIYPSEIYAAASYPTLPIDYTTACERAEVIESHLFG